MAQENSPYLKIGRLGDVIGSVTVLATHRSTTREIEKWVDDLSKVNTADDKIRETLRWTSVFEDHPEFFIVYRLEERQPKKAALRLRYSDKTIDNKTGEPPPNFLEMNSQERSHLGSPKLSHDVVDILVSAAIGLHSAALARKTDARFWFGFIAPVLSLVGVILGAVLGHFLSDSATPPIPKLQIVLSAPAGTKAFQPMQPRTANIRPESAR